VLIFQSVLKNALRTCGLDSAGSEYATGSGSCKHGNDSEIWRSDGNN
jgi:hypothetical protein